MVLKEAIYKNKRIKQHSNPKKKSTPSDGQFTHQ